MFVFQTVYPSLFLSHSLSFQKKDKKKVGDKKKKDEKGGDKKEENGGAKKKVGKSGKKTLAKYLSLS